MKRKRTDWSQIRPLAYFEEADVAVLLFPEGRAIVYEGVLGQVIEAIEDPSSVEDGRADLLQRIVGWERWLLAEQIIADVKAIADAHRASLAA
jgi:hypothetical protein